MYNDLLWIYKVDQNNLILSNGSNTIVMILSSCGTVFQEYTLLHDTTRN